MTESERKLKLTRLLREENAMNRVKMKSREEILYGSGKPMTAEEIPLVYEGYLSESGYEMPGPRTIRSSFGMRTALALLLFGLVIYLDRSDTALRSGQPLGEMIQDQLSVSMEDRLARAVGLFSAFDK